METTTKHANENFLFQVILASCSNYFKQLLRQQHRTNPNANQLIFLKGVAYNDLVGQHLPSYLQQSPLVHSWFSFSLFCMMEHISSLTFNISTPHDIVSYYIIAVQKSSTFLIPASMQLPGPLLLYKLFHSIIDQIISC